MYTISSDRTKASSLPPKMLNHDIVPSNRAHPPTDYVQYSAAPTSYGEHETHHGMAKPVTAHASGRSTMLRGDQGRSFSSDETALNKQILAIHAAVTGEELNIRPVLSLVDHIIRLGKPITADIAHETLMQANLEAVDEKSLVAHSSHQNHKDFHSHHDPFLSSSEHDAEIVKLLAFPISKISSEMVCKCAAGSAAHSITMDLLKSLASYSWDAKAVITFAAFAIKYGEFWLVEHLQTKNSLAKNIAILKDLPGAMEHNGELRKTFEEVRNLLDATMKVTHCIVEFHELPSPYVSRESPEMIAATAHIPIAVYWIIRSLLVCKSLLVNLTGSQSEYMKSTAESWEVLSLSHKLSVILDHLQKQLMICRDIIERKKAEDSYIAFKKLMEQSHIDNMKVLKAIILSREDQRPLYDGSKRINERLEVLRMKYVLVLISDLQLPQEELNILHLIFNQSTMRHEYEVLWLPIVSPTHSLPSSQDTLFFELRNNNMPWYSVDHPSLVDPVAIRYIREIWRFNHMPMLVVLDPQGKASNIDALPMMWIWGSNAFPFTKIREKALWMENKWNIELLADAIDPRIPEWIRSNRVICLYGGEDIEWIRKFTLSARAVANALQVPLEMLYVGKRNPKAKVQHCHDVINREKLSHVFSPKDYYDYIWYFWVRLWSMWNSKKQLGMTIENDNIMQEIMDLLTFDSSEQGWAVFSRGNYEMTKGKGDVILPVMENYERWGYKVDHSENFVLVLDEEIKGTSTEHHCNRLILPGHAGYIPDQVVCSECGKTMDKYVMYRCCTD